MVGFFLARCEDRSQFLTNLTEVKNTANNKGDKDKTGINI